MHAQKIHQLSIKIGFIGLIKKTTKKTVTTMFAQKKNNQM